MRLQKILIFGICAVIVCGCIATKQEQKTEVVGVKVLFILAPENFRDEEFAKPRDILRDAGFDIVVTGPGSGTFRGMLGTTVRPDISLGSVRVDDYAAVVVVGGSGSRDWLWNDTKVFSIVSEANSKGKVVAGICASGAVLAKAGVLNGRAATAFPDDEIIQILKERGAKYIKRGVVVDGKIITAEGPANAEEFGESILAALR